MIDTCEECPLISPTIRRQLGISEKEDVIVIQLLTSLAGTSPRTIAAKLGVSKTTVIKVRKKLIEGGQLGQLTFTTGKDGKRYKVKREIQRHPDDWYKTPRKAVLALLEKEEFRGEVWECACGDGAISDVLIEHDMKVYSSDLVDRGCGDTFDFLTSNRTTDNIITNPPYRDAEDFVKHALSASHRKVAMLLQLAFLEGENRHQTIWNLTPLKAVYVFIKRVSMYPGDANNEGHGRTAFAWFVWDHEYKQYPVIDWI